MRGLRTYSHLENLGRKPGDYDIGTSELLYYPTRGFEVRTAAVDWYARHQLGSPLRSTRWDDFRDPRETTYARYVALQRESETFADGLARVAEDTDYDRRLDPKWLETLDAVLPTLRYPFHGLQMVASYVGSMAPSSRIVCCALFQTGDEIRRIQRVAYRMRQLAAVRESFGARSREAWEKQPEWQPLRALVERLLVRYDWGEALVALNLVVKPAIDRAFMVWFARSAEARGDRMLGELFCSLERDCRWHREWTVALLRTCMEDNPANRGVVSDWIGEWRRPTETAIAALEPVLGGESGTGVDALDRSIHDVWAELDATLGGRRA